MKKWVGKIFFFYCALLAFIIALSGIVVGLQKGNLITQLFFLPVAFYFLLAFLTRKYKSKKQHKSSANAVTVGFFVITNIFIVLLGVGFYNVINYQIKSSKKVTATPTKTPLPNKKPITSSESAVLTIIVKTDSPNSLVNIREKPEKSAKAISKVRDGQKYSVVLKEASWYKINLQDNITGWISSELVEIVN